MEISYALYTQTATDDGIKSTELKFVKNVYEFSLECKNDILYLRINSFLHPLKYRSDVIEIREKIKQILECVNQDKDMVVNVYIDVVNGTEVIRSFVFYTGNKKYLIDFS